MDVRLKCILNLKELFPLIEDICSFYFSRAYSGMVKNNISTYCSSASSDSLGVVNSL